MASWYVKNSSLVWAVRKSAHSIESALNLVSFQDVCRKTPRCTVGVVANTSDEEYLKRFYTDTLYRQIKYVSSYTQGIDLLRSREITYLLMDHSMARYYLTRDVFKLIRISGDNFGTFGLALGFSKFEGALKDNITSILLSYIEKGRRAMSSSIPLCVFSELLGIIQRLHDDWYVYENCETKRLNEVGTLIFPSTHLEIGRRGAWEIIEWFRWRKVNSVKASVPASAHLSALIEERKLGSLFMQSAVVIWRDELRHETTGEVSLLQVNVRTGSIDRCTVHYLHECSFPVDNRVFARWMTQNPQRQCQSSL